MSAIGLGAASSREQGGAGSDIGTTEETDGVRRRERDEAAPRPAPIRVRPRWPLGVYRVVGESMLPAYRPGDTLLGWRWFRPRPGQVVVARVGDRPLIKRLARPEPAGFWLLGDNPGRSTDSRHFGPVSREQLKVVVIARLG